MTRRAPLPSGLPPHFTVANATAAGVSARGLRATTLAAPFHGIRSRVPLDGAERIRAYAPKLRPGEEVSHASALLLVGGWVPDRLRDAVDVSAVRPTGRPRGAGVRGHEADALSGCHCGGIPIVHPADAWCQLAGSLTHRELVIAGDALLRRQHPILTLADLEAAVGRRAGRRGVVKLREALERVRARTDSVAETELRLDAEDAGLPRSRSTARSSTSTGDASRSATWWIASAKCCWNTTASSTAQTMASTRTTSTDSMSSLA